MKLSVVSYNDILLLINNALTDKIDDCEIFIKCLKKTYSILITTKSKE